MSLQVHVYCIIYIVLCVERFPKSLLLVYTTLIMYEYINMSYSEGPTTIIIYSLVTNFFNLYSLTQIIKTHRL